MQRFTPRKPGSNWSKVNVEKVGEARGGRADAAGRAAAFEARDRRQDRRVLLRAARRELPPEYEERLRANKAAAEYFDVAAAVVPADRHHLVMSAKREETRLRRLEGLIEDSAAGRT